MGKNQRILMQSSLLDFKKQHVMLYHYLT